MCIKSKTSTVVLLVWFCPNIWMLLHIVEMPPASNILQPFNLEFVVVVSMEPLNTVNKKDVGTYC